MTIVKEGKSNMRGSAVWDINHFGALYKPRRQMEWHDKLNEMLWVQIMVLIKIQVMVHALKPFACPWFLYQNVLSYWDYWYLVDRLTKQKEITTQAFLLLGCPHCYGKCVGDLYGFDPTTTCFLFLSCSRIFFLVSILSQWAYTMQPLVVHVMALLTARFLVALLHTETTKFLSLGIYSQKERRGKDCHKSNRCSLKTLSCL